ncbi:MAG: RHS repeat-associated core domain-containing protein [Thermoanaerobaculia bacterium]
MAAAFVVVTASANGAELKFHPAPGAPPVVGRYLVTLDPSVPADLAHALAEALARAYVGQLEPFASSDVRQFAIAMLPARARSLSADSRVLNVVEIPHPDDALAPPPSPSSATAGLARQHLIPITRDSSSSGTYLYDGSGNIRSIGTDSFVYDSVGRLTQATVQGNQQNFAYDAFGNRTATVTASGAVGCVGGCDVPDTAVTSQTSPQNHNHLAAATYDDAGNVTSEYGAAYTYDGTGMVRRATVGSDVRDFVYTADDERIAVRQGASWTWSVRDQSGKVLREFTSLETSPSPLTLTSHYWSKDYVWRSGQLLASVFPITPGSTSPTTTYHYHLDHLGTPRLVTDGNHILIGKHAYYPFGAEMNLTPTESATELMKFTGHERDIVAATNGSVDYMHARYYNANLARFLSVDPVLGDPKQPQSWNRYAYVMNNPTGATDPNGRFGKSIFQKAIEAQAKADGDLAAKALRVLNSNASAADKANAAIILTVVVAKNIPVLPEGEAAVAVEEIAATAKLEAYTAGTADELRAMSAVGDGLDIHHVPQSAAARQVIPEYDARTGPAIAVPQAEHQAIPTIRGTYGGTARSLVAKDIRDLRNLTEATNKQINQLLEYIMPFLRK